MKKYLLMLSGIFIFACNQSSNTKETNEHADHESAASAELTLNNGAKWKADSMTNRHLVRLKTIANMFKVDPFPPVDQYHILSADLKGGLDSMVQDCKLTGAQHEALHKWMNPILRQTNELQNVSDTVAARSVFDSLDQRINLYYNYFE